MEYVLGFLIALTIGLTGVGGGTLTVPILILFLGVPTAEAVGTALAFSALVKLPACLVYLKEGNVDGRVLRYVLLGGVPGVVGGSLLLQRLEGAGLKNAVLVLVGLTIAAMATFNLVKLVRGNGAAPCTGPDRSHVLPWLTFPIGLEVGFSSAGAGALGTLALLYCTPLTAAQVVGTDLVFGMTLSMVGGALHMGMGEWSRALFVKLVLGGLPGSFAGARLASVLPARTLRMILLVWLVYLGSQLFYKGLHALTV